MRIPWQLSSVAIALALLISQGSPISSQVSSAVGTRTYNLMGITFSPSLSLSEPMPVRNGVALLYPATATLGNEDFRVTLINLPVNNVQENLTPTEMSQWVRFSLLNLTKAPEGEIERVILGKRLIGDIQLQKSKREIYQEIYLIPLSAGGQLVMMFDVDTRLSLQTMESLIKQVSQTMQELSPESKEWKRSFKLERKKS
jgi:hypothetical protein